MVSLPDRSQWWLLLPAPALAAWVGTIGYGCLTDWVNIGPDGVHMGEAVRCFATLVLTSVPLAIALAVMLRYAALLRAGAVTMAGALAVAAITSSALSLLYDLDATLIILIWNLGTAALITGLGGVFGRRVLRRTELRLLVS
jgi:Negative regulator of sigma F